MAPAAKVTKSKIVKKNGEAPTAIEKRIATEMSALEGGHDGLRSVLKNLTFSAAKEVDIEGGRKAVVVFVPQPLLSEYRKIQKHLVEELEKKIGGGTAVIIIANRTMMSHAAWQRSGDFTGVRPRSRTLKAVQEALLDDVLYPTEAVGKRTRVKTDGSRLMKVLLSPKDSNFLEGRTDVFRAVYKRLTNKDITFEFAH